MNKVYTDNQNQIVRSVQGFMDRIRKSKISMLPLVLLVVYILLYLSCMFVIQVVWDFPLFVSDARTYWEYSLHLDQPYSTWWVPGYPFILAMTRLMTRSFFSPLQIMQLITFLGFVLSGQLIFRLCQAKDLDSHQASLLTLAFGAFPFVGITYAVYPIADTLVFVLLVGLLYSLEQRRHGWALVLIAFALMTHKITWYFIPGVFIYLWIKDVTIRKYLLLPILPLAILEIAGSVYHQNVFWMLGWSYNKLLAPRGGIPFLDGILGPWSGGDFFDKGKSLIIIGLLIWGAILLHRSIAKKLWIPAIFTIGFLAIIVSINQYENWAVVRFGKMLIPLSVLSFGNNLPFMPKHWTFRHRAVSLFTLLAFYVSNLWYGHYMTQYW